MDEKKYQVFVSSTYVDLVDARNKIIETILSLYHFPVGMEMFSADDSEQWEIIQETINISDYYVIIIGHKYGSVAADGISYTEKEYDYAKEKGLPILAFIRDRFVATLPHEREVDIEKEQKLQKFIEKATANKMCDFWYNIDDLATKVAIALPKIFRRTPQIGWIRGDEAISKEVSKELVSLSTENRQLRTKLEYLESQIIKELPDIRVTINSSQIVEINHTDLAEIRVPELLKLEDVSKQLEPFITAEDIESYNKNLPSEDVIKKYNEESNFYEYINNEPLELNFEIINKGNTKANDIFVTLDFPDFVRVIEKDDIVDINQPSNPIPSNPILKANEKYQKSLIDHRIGAIMAGSPLLGLNHAFPEVNFSRYTNLAKLHTNLNYSSSVNDNTVQLRLNNLIHTRMKNISGDIVIAPLRKGSGKINVTIICEEYKVESKFTLNILVS
ncbi:DUF4062 domain-containing protein [Aliivibrio sifiae]|uniref:DUF4062 domain-containing protein n=1 Tax=Aliivibrio sifiae TaxID=566293 RepID=A0A2S7X815_9GAMM|nr:DUF4062 domain-containing protein [Aliivibrio sifiae]PQJ87490.1 hypothetical protein BTO23_15390 [Aliivibrio sifiae]GLR77147.1 hypothetical protein GCM10007855_40220 [Aliivibrio sifiae]